MRTVGYRQWQKNVTFYVAQLPKGKSDWGYTDRVDGHNGLDKAIDLSSYWQARFRKDCERVGSDARFLTL